MDDKIQLGSNEILKKSIKEVSDYKYALEEACIVAITDQKGIIKYANDNFCKISKFSQSELIGKDHRIINSGFHSVDFMKELWRTIASGKIWRGEIRNRAKDHSLYWVDTTIVPFLNESGKPYQYVAIRSDITARKEAEQENFRLKTELEERVRQRTEELEAFSYSISHDLRAPLRAINGYAMILNEEFSDVLNDEGKRLLNVIYSNARMMGILIDDLLTFSKLGRKEILRSQINMNSLLENVWNEVCKMMPNKARFTYDQLPSVNGDNPLIAQVFVNLLTNAVKYSSRAEDPQIHVSCHTENNEHIFKVTDNGAGFDERYKHKLFGVFQRLHAAEEFEGTGVGLALVKRIIDKHGGRVWAEGEIGKGAGFSVSLPALSTIN